jgi:hypothetical protein
VSDAVPSSLHLSTAAALPAIFNSLLHIVMYYYYAMTALRPHVHIWWKKYLTALQLVIMGQSTVWNVCAQIQFSIGLVLGIIGLYINCPFPRWMGYTLVAYMVSFIVLFSNFWYHAYDMATVCSMTHWDTYYVLPCRNDRVPRPRCAVDRTARWHKNTNVLARRVTVRRMCRQPIMIARPNMTSSAGRQRRCPSSLLTHIFAEHD